MISQLHLDDSPCSAFLVIEERLEVDPREVSATERDKVNPQEGQVKRRVGVDHGVEDLNLVSSVEVRESDFSHLRAGEAHAAWFRTIRESDTGGTERLHEQRKVT